MFECLSVLLADQIPGLVAQLRGEGGTDRGKVAISGCSSRRSHEQSGRGIVVRGRMADGQRYRELFGGKFEPATA